MIFRTRRRPPRRRIFDSVREPDPTRFTQDQQRERRRKHLTVVYDGSFDLAAEVDAVLAPLAARPEIGRYDHLVGQLTLAVHQLVLDVDRLLTERQARHKAMQLPFEQRGRAVQLLVAAQHRPAPPVVDRDAIVTGAWSTILVDHTRPLSVPLADYLKVALPPGQTSGAVAVSDRIVQCLRELDRAVVNAGRRLDNLEHTRKSIAPTLPTQLRHLQPSPEELRRLGLT